MTFAIPFDPFICIALLHQDTIDMLCSLSTCMVRQLGLLVVKHLILQPDFGSTASHLEFVEQPLKLFVACSRHISYCYTAVNLKHVIQWRTTF